MSLQTAAGEGVSENLKNKKAPLKLTGKHLRTPTKAVKKDRTPLKRP